MTSFNINVIQVDRKTIPNRKGNTNVQLELTYKNLTTGKLESKKIIDFSPVFKVLSDSKAGDVFSIESEKNNNTGYWDWLKAAQEAPGQMSTETPEPKAQTRGTWKDRDYETAEERAQKQVYIVKQSSISNALEFLKHNNAKTTFSGEQVLEVAQKFTDFVFGKEDLFSKPNDLPE